MTMLHPFGTTLICALVAGGGWMIRQDPSPGARSPAPNPTTAPIQDPTRQDPATPSTKQLWRWIDRLGSDRFEQRNQAEENLRAAGEAARGVLTEAAQSDDLDVRTRVRRLLDELDEPNTGLQPRGETTDPDVEPQAAPDGRSDPRLESMLERFERMQRDFSGFGPDLQRLFERTQVPGMAFDFNGMTSGTRIQLGPDGVRVQVEEQSEDGSVEQKVYEAPDMDAFRTQYPEVAERLFPQGAQGQGFGFHGFGLREFADTDGDGLPDAQMPGFGAPDLPGLPVSPPAEGERLGVQVEPIDPAVGEFLGLEPGVGLIVRSTIEDSLAASLGLQERDVIVSVAGRPIRSVEDVRLALRGVPKGETVAVVAHRPGQRLELETTKVHDAPSADADGQSTDAPARLERRR